MNHKKFLNKLLQDEVSIEEIIAINEDKLKLFYNKLKSKLNNICDKYDSFNELLLFNMTKLDIKKPDNFKSNIKCNQRYKILYMIISLGNEKHLNIFVIDHKKKVVERFDTQNQNKQIMEKATKALIQNLGFKYKIKNQTKFIFETTTNICALCVPLSLIYVYMKITFETSNNKLSSQLKKLKHEEL